MEIPSPRMAWCGIVALGWDADKLQIKKLRCNNTGKYEYNQVQKEHLKYQVLGYMNDFCTEGGSRGKVMGSLKSTGLSQWYAHEGASL